MYLLIIYLFFEHEKM